MPSSLSFSLYNSSDLLFPTHARGHNNVNLERCHFSSNNNDTHERETYRTRLARQRVILDKNWRKPNLRHENKSTVAEPLKIGRNDNLSFNSSQHRQSFPSRWNRSMTMDDSKQLAPNSQTLLTDNGNSRSSPSPTESKIGADQPPLRASILPTNKLAGAETRRASVSLPVRSSSLPQSKLSNSNLSTGKRQTLTSSPNSMQLFMPKDRSRQPSPNVHPKAPSSPIDNRSPLKKSHQQLSSSDDDEAEANDLKNEDLKRRLKEEKRQGKRTAEVLSKLHETYEELLEKYAQAENTIDQLRFQPTHSRSASRFSGTCHSLSLVDSPFSPMPPTSCLVTSAMKIDSVYYDETASQKNLVPEPTIPETVKLDLLIHTKTLGDNMKSFLTLMDANQVNETEQKQAYENIKQDYNKLISTLEQKKQDGGLPAVNLDSDLNKELELMKRLLKEIATRITGNLFGKSTSTSPFDRHTLLIYEDSHSSQFDRSSLCNHDDLMDQYKKLLNAVNTENADKKDRLQSMMNGLEIDLKKSKTVSPPASLLDLFHDQATTDRKQKPYVYTSGGSEDDHQQSYDISPIPFMKGIESTSSDLNPIPSTYVQQQEQTIQEEPPPRPPSILIKKQAVPIKQEYHRLGDILITDPEATDSRSNSGPSQDECTEEIITHTQNGKRSSPELQTDVPRNSNNSSKTRAHDCDSGIGTNTVTKFTCDSKHCATPMDESQLQSLDEGQASISSSLLSTGSDSGNLFGKYIKRFTSPTIRRQKASQPSDSCLSDVDTPLLHPSDSLSQRSSHPKKMHRSSHIWKPQRTSSPHRSRLTLFNRSVSIGHGDIEDYKTKAHQPLVATRIQTRVNTDPTQHSIPRRHRSSLYINHIEERTKEAAPPEFDSDSQKNVVYRYHPVESYHSMKCEHRISPQKKVYRCAKCGSITPYHPRRHGNSALRQTSAQIDDLGYESGPKKRSQSCQHVESASSSDSDSDLCPTYRQMVALNEAFDRAEKVENCSQRLSRYITRQLKLALTLI